MQPLNFKEINILNVILAAAIVVTIILMVFFNYKVSNKLDRNHDLLTIQAGNIVKLEAKIKELETENLELKQTLSLYNEKNFKKLLITISEHDRKIDLLNKTIRKLY